MSSCKPDKPVSDTRFLLGPFVHILPPCTMLVPITTPPERAFVTIVQRSDHASNTMDQLQYQALVSNEAKIWYLMYRPTHVI
eukprot:3406055-Amphidinium_carterae.1